jgi:ligand-binding SRPBCC domain-containing protein
MISLYSQTSGPRADAIDFGEAANGRGFRLKSAVILPHPRECVFAFFADAMQLETLTPTWLQFEVVTPGPICLQEGAIIDYRLKLHGFPIRWRSRISVWEPPFRFVDEQIRGPYRRWEHEHLFEEVDGGTRCRDIVHYEVPGGRLLERLLVRPDLRVIFEFRRQKLRELFAASATSRDER